MGKGQIYFSGHNVGRYWDIVSTGQSSACWSCEWFTMAAPLLTCGTGCGEITQP
eukprot:UN16973